MMYSTTMFYRAVYSCLLRKYMRIKPFWKREPDIHKSNTVNISYVLVAYKSIHLGLQSDKKKWRMIDVH